MPRERMGPPASEPEQRDYAITITAPDGTTTSAGIVRHVHALDAAREAAEAQGLVWRSHTEHPDTGGAWALTTLCMHRVRAELDTPQARTRWSEQSQRMVRHEAERRVIERVQNDERAAVQRRIADAIRTIDDEEAKIIADGLELVGDGVHFIDRNDLAVMAAVARSPVLLDAVRQVAQVHRLNDE